MKEKENTDEYNELKEKHDMYIQEMVGFLLCSFFFFALLISLYHFHVLTSQYKPFILIYQMIGSQIRSVF